MQLANNVGFTQDEKYHTELALQYADKVVRLAALEDEQSDKEADPGEQLRDAREQLQHVLSTSQYYDAAAVLACVRHCSMLHQEKAHLLGRIVNKLKLI